MPDKLPARLYKQWLEEQVKAKRPYWYGCCHDPCTQAKLQEKTKQFPEHYTADRMARYQADIAAGQIAGDCVGGAIKGAAWTLLGTSSKVKGRLGCPDKSANGMFDYCKSKGVEWGDISTLPEIPCVAVRKPGHVGVYIGNGKVVEWEGFNWGCVMTDLKKRPWTHWYKLPWVDYSDTSGGTTTGTQKPSENNSDKPSTQLQKCAVKGVRIPVYGEAPQQLPEPIGYVSEPNTVTVYGTKNGWVAVKFSNGKKGYISKDALE